MAVAATTARPQRHEQRDTVLVRARDRVTRKDLILTVSRDAGMEDLVDSYKQKIVEIADRTQQWLAKADAAYERDARAHNEERARAAGSHAAMISVMDHGAKGDGVADDRAAFEAAVAAARGTTNAVLLPAGHTFLLSPIALVEESDLEIRIDGVVRAPPMDRWPPPPREDSALSAERQRVRYAFLELRRCRAIVISGRGTIEGQGQPWWALRKVRPEVRAPALLVIRESRDCAVRFLSLVESPFYHVVVLDSERVTLDRLRIATPPGSVNTDPRVSDDHSANAAPGRPTIC